MNTLRRMQFAGRAYFADAGRMRAAVESLIEDANPPHVPGRICGIFVPYGPLIEFGSSAGFAYKSLSAASTAWSNIILLAPTPLQAARPMIEPCSGYDTLLEPLELDDDLRAAWLKQEVIDAAPDPEPIIEMHAHFAITALGSAPALPLRVPDGMPLTTLQAHAARLQQVLVVCCCNLPAPILESVAALVQVFNPAKQTPSRSRKLFGRQQQPAVPAIDFAEPELHLAREAALLMRMLGANACMPVSPTKTALVAYAA